MPNAVLSGISAQKARLIASGINCCDHVWNDFHMQGSIWQHAPLLRLQPHYVYILGSSKGAVTTASATFHVYVRQCVCISFSDLDLIGRSTSI
jgi:hypothetical protein